VFDQQQDRRSLSTEELALHSDLKVKCQRSRALFLAERDANTRFFHLQACHRNRANHIGQIVRHSEVLVHEEDKVQTVFEHFDAIFGDFEDRSHALDFDRLGIPSQVFSSHDHCFSELEVWSIIKLLKPDKAPGPHYFTALFYRTAWPVIKHDVMNAFAALWSLDCRSLYLLNQAYMVMLKKKQDAHEDKDYHPISLIHSFSKLATKSFSTTASTPHGQACSA
jgi:hypothetical protein